MKRFLLDTNIVLDVLLDRKPHARASAALWASIESKYAEGFLAAHAVTTIFYLLEKDLGSATAKKVVAAMLGIFSVAPIGTSVLRDALDLATPDYEDAVTAISARDALCDAIITRDLKGFPNAQPPAITPSEALALIAS